MIHCNNALELSLLYVGKPILYFLVSIINSNVNIKQVQFKRMKYVIFLDLSSNNIDHACDIMGAITITTKLQLLNLSSNHVYIVRKNCFGDLRVDHINFQINRVRHVDTTTCTHHMVSSF